VPLKGLTGHTTKRTHLCSMCTKPLIKGCYACTNCSPEFKERSSWRRLFLRTTPNNWIIRSCYRNNSIYYDRRIRDGVFCQPPSALRSVALHLNQKRCLLPAGASAKLQVRNKFPNMTRHRKQPRPFCSIQDPWRHYYGASKALTVYWCMYN
jgi:hypothetical protein